MPIIVEDFNEGTSEIVGLTDAPPIELLSGLQSGDPEVMDEAIRRSGLTFEEFYDSIADEVVKKVTGFEGDMRVDSYE